jgi:hypothetical protein
MSLTSGHTKMAAALLVPLSWSKWTIAGVGALGYICLVRALRWRRYNAMLAKYGHKGEGLTLQEAQKIVQESAFWDIPLILNHAMSFALFKTYGIVSAPPKRTPKRQLIFCVCLNSPQYQPFCLRRSSWAPRRWCRSDMRT